MKFLLENNAITEQQEQEALARSLETQEKLGQILLDMNCMDAATLSQWIRKNLKAKIQDCLAWNEAEVEFVEGNEFLQKQVPFKMDLLRMLLDAPSNSEYEQMAFYKGEKKLKLSLPKQLDTKKLELTASEVSLLKQLQKPVFFKDVCEKLKLLPAEAAPIVVVFLNIGFIQEVSIHEELSLDELVGITLASRLQAAEVAVSVSEVDEKTLAIANEVAQNHLHLTQMNYFELLHLEETATFVQIRDQFIEFCKKFNPARFDAPQVKQFASQAEEVFLRGVKAFSILSEFDTKTKYLDKLKSDRSQQSAEAGKKKPGEAFKIQTQLLDANSQFQKGLNYLRTKNYAQAHEFFSYACDIDSGKLDYIAHLAWAKFQMSPERNKNDAREIFERAIKTKQENAFVEHFYGRLLAETGNNKEAIAHLKKACLLDSKNPDFSRELRRVEAIK